MSIKINGVNAIDDDRNFSSAGIVTVGTGSSATIINGTTGITSVGIGVTIDGISGNISIAGTITAVSVNIPANLVGSSSIPAIGTTSVLITTSISLVFDQLIGTGNTGYLYLREGSPGGTTFDTFGVDDVTIVNGIGNVLFLTPRSPLRYSTDIYVVIEEGFISNSIGLNTTGADSYSFTTIPVELGDPYEGGYLLCQSGGIQWVVAPSTSEVTRSWNDRNDANISAQQVSGCTGWFVPSCGQLQNPGYTCRIYWDSCQNTTYWSNTENSANFAWRVNPTNNGTTAASGLPNYYRTKTWPRPVRSFKCVTY